jgi:hypothetical protein
MQTRSAVFVLTLFCAVVALTTFAMALAVRLGSGV